MLVKVNGASSLHHQYYHNWIFLKQSEVFISLLFSGVNVLVFVVYSHSLLFL